MSHRSQHVYNPTSCCVRCISASLMNMPRIPRAGECPRFNPLPATRGCTALWVRRVAGACRLGDHTTKNNLGAADEMAHKFQRHCRSSAWKRTMPPSLVAMFSAINCQMMSNGTINVGNCTAQVQLTAVGRWTKHEETR